MPLVTRPPRAARPEADVTLAANPTTKLVWVCDVCKRRDHWGEGWSWFGSSMHMDWSPEDLLTTCSSDCRRHAVVELAAGRMALPVFTIRSGEYHPVMVQPRRGY
jgi:hypothetical protein